MELIEVARGFENLDEIRGGVQGVPEKFDCEWFKREKF